MDEALELLQAKDTKERMAAVERLLLRLEQSRKRLSSTEVSCLVDASLVLLRDNNSRVCEGTLHALASASSLAGEHLKSHFVVLLPAIIERLGDGKQPVRLAARRLLLALMEISSLTIIVERTGSYARAHKNWRVREEFARTIASAVNLLTVRELPFQWSLLPSVIQFLEDPNSNVREAAMACLEEIYQLCGASLQDELQHHILRPSHLKEILGRFAKLKPKPLLSSKMAKPYEGDMKVHSKHVNTGNRWNSPKRKTVSLDASSHGGESNNTTSKPVNPVQVCSEKDLIKVIEKVSTMLVPEQDWSVRITAMQRIEGLIAGGAVEYASFPSLIKQLVRPLSLQLADRRSIIIKQACHLLNLLSRELLADFEQCAEVFVPVLFKLVVITVLVIAESADTCIKTMLRNCRVARVMPRIINSAKNDRSSVLRARCSEYALLVLEQWSHSPDIQKLVDMYEDFIKCCVGDAMSEVRSTARACYRVFSKCWPDHAYKLFSSFDPLIQRLINEEGGVQKQYISPCLRDKASQQLQQHSATGASGTQSASAGAISMTGVCNTLRTTTDNLRGTQVGNVVAAPFSNLAVKQTGCADFGRASGSAISLMLPSAKRVPINLDKCNQGNASDEGFQRPLMRATTSIRSSSRSSLDEAQVAFGDVYSYVDGFLSLNHALTEGLSLNADWSVRVAAFHYLKRLVEQGSKGIQDIMQSFEKVMKLFSMHLDDPHHKVAQAALSTLTEVVPACCKPFESYLEQTLPNVFARLVDSKEYTRRLSTSALEIVGNLYSIDSLFPALLRSLDEQRSPRIRIAVIDFTVATFSKLASNGEASAGSNLLNLWLAKLASLANDKNAKLKESAVNAIISVYRRFDSSTVLNFILSLTIEEQGNLRRALRQYTPRIETELMSFPPNWSQKYRSGPNHKRLDVSCTSDNRMMLGRTNHSPANNQLPGTFSLPCTGESVLYENKLSESSMNEHPTLRESTLLTGIKKSTNVCEGKPETSLERVSNMTCNNLESNQDDGIVKLTPMDAQLHLKNIRCNTSVACERENINNWRNENGQSSLKAQLSPEEGAENLPIWLSQLSGSGKKAVEKKRSALQKFIQLSRGNPIPTLSQHRTQIVTGLLGTLDDADPSIRELALLTVLEMLGNQDILEKDSMKLLLEKLLHCTGDLVPKVSTAADRCISLMLSQYDPHHCLSVIVPHLGIEEEKMLVTYIGCLTKLAVRLPSEDLLSRLPSFLPAIFDAFGHHNADVRKAVVFCLVDIYIVLGKAFLPYLSSLRNTQLRLVTIYANRISQARSGAPITS